MGNLEDWDVFAILPAVTGTSAFCGLIDRAPLTRADDTRKPLEPRPAFWTLRLLISALGNYAGYERLSPGPGVYAYCFSAPTHAGMAPSNVVAWFENGNGRLPGDPPPMVRVSIPTVARRVLRTPVITRIGRRESSWKPLDVSGGRMTFTLSSTPVLLREE